MFGIPVLEGYSFEEEGRRDAALIGWQQTNRNALLPLPMISIFN